MKQPAVAQPHGWYLDHAAATPCDPRVIAAMLPYFNEQWYNPSAAYSPARQVRQAIEAARHRLAMTIGGQASEVIMTSGATESINLAVHGVMRSIGGHVVTSAIEHSAVLASARHYPHAIVPVDSRGGVAPAVVAAAVTDDTSLVSIGYANGELGTVQHISTIATALQSIQADRQARGVNRPLLFHVDASQAVGFLGLQTARLGVDLLTFGAAKCYGPKGIGLLWARANVPLRPLLDGGGQERGVRSGTENVPAIIGFAEAVRLAETRRKEQAVQLGRTRDALQAALLAAVPAMVVNGHPKRRLPGHLHIALPGLDAERAVFALDQQGVYVATGSACAANKGTRSHVLTAIGMPPALADGSLRLSLGYEHIGADMPALAGRIAAVLRRERELS